MENSANATLTLMPISVDYTLTEVDVNLSVLELKKMLKKISQYKCFNDRNIHYKYT